MIKIADQAFDAGAEAAAFAKRADRAGAVVSFIGKVRGTGGKGNVRSLCLDHYPGVTEKSIAAIVDRATRKWRLDDVLIIHRVGVMAPGDDIVLVCTASAHRRDAFEATDFLMDFLKTKAMFWKKEICDSGEEWIEPREDDYRDAARWDGD